MAKRAKPRKAVSKRSASGRKAKRSSAAKTAKKKTAKKAAVKAGRKTATAKRTKSSAGGRVAPAKVKKTGTRAKATKGRAEKKRLAPKRAATVVQSATSQDPIRLPGGRRRAPKTYLTKKQLEEFRQLLLAKRSELASDVHHLTRDAFDRKGHGRGEQSAMPIHMAELGSDNWEKEFTLGLIETEQAMIREIDEALTRINDRTYGICLATHQKISLARLRAKPWAKYCIAYARAREEGRAP